MTRAKNDRNIIKFGPTRAGLDPELKILRDENRRLEFRLNQQALILPEPGVPVTPPVVVPGDLNTVLQAGFPYVLNDLGDTVVTLYSSLTKTKKINRLTGGITSNQGFLIAGRQNIHYVDFPSGSVTSIPFVGASGTPISIGNKLLISRETEAVPLTVYDFSTGLYTNIEINELDFMKDEWEAEFDDLWENQRLSSVIYKRSRGMDPVVFSDETDSFYLPRLVSIRPNGSGSQITYGAYHKFNASTLSREDVYFGLSRTGLAGDDLFPSGVASSNSKVFYTSLGRNGNLRRLYSFDSSDNNNVNSFANLSQFPQYFQLDKGFVDDEGRAVYMEYNVSSGLWEIHRIDSFGIRSTLPLVFSGNPSDQPNVFRVTGSSSYSTSNIPITKPGVAQAPDGGYFIYGGVVENFGETGPTDGGPVLVSIPAIWYTNGITTQRIWTLPDSLEAPLDLLYAPSDSVHINPGGTQSANNFTLRDRRLNCSVQYVKYNESTRQLDFLVRAGAAAQTGFQAVTVISDESRLYRVQL